MKTTNMQHTTITRTTERNTLPSAYHCQTLHWATSQLNTQIHCTLISTDHNHQYPIFSKIIKNKCTT